jgi:hypothetical protein
MKALLDSDDGRPLFVGGSARNGPVGVQILADERIHGPVGLVLANFGPLPQQTLRLEAGTSRDLLGRFVAGKRVEAQTRQLRVLRERPSGNSGQSLRRQTVVAVRMGYPVADIPMTRSPDQKLHGSNRLVVGSIRECQGNCLPFDQEFGRILDMGDRVLGVEGVGLLGHPAVHLGIAPGGNQRGDISGCPRTKMEACKRYWWIGKSQTTSHP